MRNGPSIDLDISLEIDSLTIKYLHRAELFENLYQRTMRCNFKRISHLALSFYCSYEGMTY